MRVMIALAAVLAVSACAQPSNHDPAIGLMLLNHGAVWANRPQPALPASPQTCTMRQMGGQWVQTCF